MFFWGERGERGRKGSGTNKTTQKVGLHVIVLEPCLKLGMLIAAIKLNSLIPFYVTLTFI